MDPFFLVFALGALALLWFMSGRTRKQQQQAARFRDNLEPGQEVMTGSGLFGTVVEVEGDRVTLEIAPGVTSQWLKPAIAKLVPPPFEGEGELVEDEFEDEFEDDDFEDEDEFEDDDEGAEDGKENAADELDEKFEVPDDASSLTPDEGDDTPR